MSCSLVRKGPAPLGDPTVEGLAAGRLPASVVDLSPGALHGIPLTASCLGGLSFLFFVGMYGYFFLPGKVPKSELRSVSPLSDSQEKLPG